MSRTLLRRLRNILLFDIRNFSNSWGYLDVGSVYYFLDGKKVSKNTFLNCGETISSRDVENGNLLISKERQFFCATLISHRKIGNSGDKLLMEFVTSGNRKFYYQGQGELTHLISDYFGDTTSPFCGRSLRSKKEKQCPTCSKYFKLPR